MLYSSANHCIMAEEEIQGKEVTVEHQRIPYGDPHPPPLSPRVLTRDMVVVLAATICDGILFLAVVSIFPLTLLSQRLDKSSDNSARSIFRAILDASTK